MDDAAGGECAAFEPTAADVLAVNNLITAFVQCLDSGDGKRLASLFTPNGTVNVSCIPFIWQVATNSEAMCASCALVSG